MATESDTYRTALLKDNIYSLCSPCKENDRNTRARHYCVECEMYFCTKCLKHHNKFPSLKSHQVNDVQASDPTNSDESVESEEDISLPSETLRCAVHQGEVIDTYCKDHDEVCCGVCAVVKHRPCTTESIAVAAKDFKQSPEVNESEEELANLLVRLKQEKEKRTEHLDHTDKAKLEIIQNVDSYEEQIIAKIKTLADSSRKDILSKFQEEKSYHDSDVGALNVVITNSEFHLNKLEKQRTDKQLQFQNVKMSKAMRKDIETLLEAMTTDWRKKEFEYNFDKTLETLVEGIESFGQLEVYSCKTVSQTPKKTSSTFSNVFSTPSPEQTGKKDITAVKECIQVSRKFLPPPPPSGPIRQLSFRPSLNGAPPPPLDVLH